MATLPLVIDSTGTTLFYLNWSGGNAPSFTLTRPDAQVIDPAYAAAHPAEVTYETSNGSPEAAPNATYNFVSGQIGTWQAIITATDAVDYKIFGLIDSTLQLTANTNAEVYQIGDTATITANLANGSTGLSGATVTAKLTRPDSVVNTVTLTDQGNGTYSNTYTIPDAPGYLTIGVTATGNDNGTTFSRQENLLVSIAPNDLQLTGTYDDQPRDDNADGAYDYLDFTAEVNLTAPGDYAVSAELYAGDQLITQSGDFFQLAAGPQTVTLPFDGAAIYAAGLNGTYTVKNLYFTPIDIGITAQSVENAWITYAYSYTQFVNVASPVDVYIGGALKGGYSLLPGTSTRQNYTGVDSGPVKVVNKINVPIISAIRSAWAVNGVTTSFSQLMGLPLEQLSDTYVFPGYNNVTLNEQLRIANVDTAPSTVTVTIGGDLKGTYPLAAGAAVRINYPGLDSGPVVVKGTSGVKIISSIREAWAVNGVTRSFVQLMGLPAGQLSNKYVFPAYNNVTLNEQLRIGNVDTVATSVTVTIGGNLQGTYPLGPGQAVRINYPGLDSGPVIVEGTAGVNIISSIRSAWAVNGVTTSFSQLMGMPAEQLADKYLFPGYNNVTLNEQLRIANVDTAQTTVTVTVGGNLKGTYPLAAGEAVRINYPGLDSGPVVVKGTSGVKIISSIREAWAVNGVTQSFVQLMGLPAGQLSTTYLFPAYNNVTLNEQLRIGMP